ncbi:MAG: hypothetical protein ACSLE0_23280 [Chitinophagaceae bacterium]
MIREILEEGRQVNLTMRGPVEVEDGLPDEATIRKQGDKLFKFVTDYLRKDILEMKKGFPKDGEAEVELSIDIVVLKGEDYRRIMKYLDKYE